MAWVENILNLTNSYYRVTSSEDDQFEYLVPCPPGYTSTTKAYWTTDVIVLEPSCSWQTADVKGSSYQIPAQAPAGSTSHSIWNVSLRESNLSISLESDSLSKFFPSNFFMCLLDFSNKPYYDADFISRGLQPKFEIHRSCGRFSNYCYR